VSGLSLNAGERGRGLSLLAVCLLLASCAKCGASSATDAGASAPDAGPARVKRNTDLRTAFLVAYPEYRGTRLLDGRASLTRRYETLTDDALEKARQANGFTVTEDGGLFRAPFTLTRPSQDTLVLSLLVDLAVVDKVFNAPLALSSTEMGLYLPRGLPVADERFDFFVHYEAVPATRAAFLTRQVVELLSRNSQWKVGALPEGWGADPGDGGFGAVPERFTVTVTEAGTDATVTVTRDGADVRVEYSVVTDTPAR